MSREFGATNGGFLYNNIEDSAESCKNGSLELTQRLGEVLDSLSEIAYAVSGAECGDESEAKAILTAIKSIDGLKESVAELEKYLKPFKEIAEKSIGKSLNSK